MSVIKVKYDKEKHGPASNTEYAYFCDYEVEVGDRVIVESPYHGYVVVTVSQVGAGLASIRATKEVVALIDDSRYVARRMAKERLAEITAELNRRAKEKINTKLLRKMFKGDVVAKSMLTEADALGHLLQDDVDSFLEATVEQLNTDTEDMLGKFYGAAAAELS